MTQAKMSGMEAVVMILMAIAMVFIVAFTATNAWFASSDYASGSLGLTGPVELSFTTGVTGDDVSSYTLDLQNINLLPSQPIAIDLGAMVQNTNTPYLVRARFVLTWAGEGAEPSTHEDMNNKEESPQTPYGIAKQKFLEFLHFDAFAGTASGVNYDWSNMQQDLNQNRNGWYYLHEQGNSQDFVVGTFHDDLEEGGQSSVSPALIGELNFKIIDNAVRRIPHIWDNDYEMLLFNVELQIEAVQAEVYQNIEQRMPTNTIADIVNVFEYVYSNKYS